MMDQWIVSVEMIMLQCKKQASCNGAVYPTFFYIVLFLTFQDGVAYGLVLILLRFNDGFPW